VVTYSQYLLHYYLLLSPCTLFAVSSSGFWNHLEGPEVGGGGCGLAFVTGPDTGSGEALNLPCRRAHNLTNQMAYSLLFNANYAICLRSPHRMSKSFAFICIVLLWTSTYLALSFVMVTDVCVTSSIPSELRILLVSSSVGWLTTVPSVDVWFEYATDVRSSLLCSSHSVSIRI
jgi:hypothetical protein